MVAIPPPAPPAGSYTLTLCWATPAGAAAARRLIAAATIEAAAAGLPLLLETTDLGDVAEIARPPLPHR
jgi:hypothetical protein